jgi:hypothetical protein
MTTAAVEIQTAPNGWEPATLTARLGHALVRTPDGRIFVDPHPDKIRRAPKPTANEASKGHFRVTSRVMDKAATA